jgi:outer membrane protein OmpA-like peptidoglycan-associated protein
MRYLSRSPYETQENSYASLAIPGIIAVLLVGFLVLILAETWLYNGSPGKITAKNPSSTAAVQKADSPALAEQKLVLKELLDLKGRIIHSLSAKLQSSGLKCSLDKQSGAVRFSDAIFFKGGQYSIEKSGEECLKKFIPIYMSVMMDKNNKKYLDEIVIEGHTDGTGTYLYNLDLSQKRAYSVAMYISGSNFPYYAEKAEVLKYLAANGRAANNPIITKGVIDMVKSRRVEFRFRLKDDEFLDKIKNALDEVKN